MECFISINPNLIIELDNKKSLQYKFKLKKSEIQVYLALYFLRFFKFSSKSLKINRVGEYTGLKRTAIYEAIKSLREKGLIKIEDGKIHYVGIDDVEWNKDFILVPKSIIDKIIKDPLELIVFLIIAKFKDITVREIARIGGLWLENVIKAINRLESKGILIIRRVGKRNYYSIPMLERKKEFPKQDQSQDKSKTFIQSIQSIRRKRNGKVEWIGEVLNVINQKRNGQSQHFGEVLNNSINHFERNNKVEVLRNNQIASKIFNYILRWYDEISYDELLEEAKKLLSSQELEEIEETLKFLEDQGFIERRGYHFVVLDKKAYV